MDDAPFLLCCHVNVSSVRPPATQGSRGSHCNLSFPEGKFPSWLSDRLRAEPLLSAARASGKCHTTRRCCCCCHSSTSRLWNRIDSAGALSNQRESGRVSCTRAYTCVHGEAEFFLPLPTCRGARKAGRAEPILFGD